MSELAARLYSAALVGFVALIALTTDAWAQSSREYRSKTSGEWNLPSTWEVDSSGIWVAAVTSPTSSDGVITIRFGHTVTVTANVTIDETIVESGGQITVASGITLTISSSELTDLEVHGRITGDDATSILNFEGRRLKLSNGVVSISRLVIDDDSNHNVEGTGTFTGCTLDIQSGYLSLSDSLSLTGGTIQLADWSTIDLNGQILMLDNVALSLNTHGEILDNSEVRGKLVTKGRTTQIAQNGVLSAALEVSGGRTKASGTGEFIGGVTVLNGATLLVPSGDTLKLAADASIDETSGSLVIGTITTWRVSDREVGSQTFGGLGLEVLPISADPGPTIVTRTTGTAPSMAGVTFIKRFFDISPSTNSGLSATFVFHYAPGELNGTTLSNLHLYKSTDGGSTWSDQGGTVDSTLSKITLTGVNSFSRWTAGQAGPARPTLTNINPSYSFVGSRALLDLTGTNFDGSSSISLSGTGVSINSVVVKSSTDLTADISISYAAPTGYRNVTVTNLNGAASIINGFQVVYPAPPLVRIPPNAARGGDVLSVILAGTDFFGGVTSLNFGSGITCDSISALNVTQLQARMSISASASMGSGDTSVSKTGPGGGTATLMGGFNIANPIAAITGATPSAGGRGVTTSVVITGRGFIQGITSVSFGAGTSVNSIVVGSASKITASVFVARDATLSCRDITVSNRAPGGGSTTLSNAFDVQNPTPFVTGASPGTGVLGQTLAVTVTGSGFLNGVSTVDFGSDVTVNSASVDTSGTRFTANIAIAAGATPGGRAVTVANSGPGGGSGSSSGAFIVANPAPTLISISPATGGKGQTLNVDAVGTHFINGTTSVSLGPGVTVNSVVVNSQTSLTANITIAVDAVTAARSVVVTNASPGGGSVTLPFVFNVQNSVPSILAISPSSGTRSQTLNMTLSGTGFYCGVTTVSFGHGITVNSTTVNGLTQMTLGISVGSDAVTGPRDVVVTNPAPGGGNATLAGSFTVTNPGPTITSVTPVSAGRGSLLKVIVIGTQFVDGVTSLSLSTEISVTNFLVKSSTEVQLDIAINPAATPGPRTVTVTNAAPGGGSASLTNGFTITSGPVTSIEGELGIIPDKYILQEAYPNPFNPSTRIRYGVPENSRIRLDVHNMLGNVVAELVSGEQSRGMYELQWHADNLPSGVYLIRLNAESTESVKRFIASRKVVLVK